MENPYYQLFCGEEFFQHELILDPSSLTRWRAGTRPRARAHTRPGQLWAYARDDRPCGGADPPIAVYVYAQTRKSEQPLAHLVGFTGVVQVDAYVGYRALAQKNSASLASFWSHVRRRFYELAAAGPARQDLLGAAEGSLA